MPGQRDLRPRRAGLGFGIPHHCICHSIVAIRGVAIARHYGRCERATSRSSIDGVTRVAAVSRRPSHFNPGRQHRVAEIGPAPQQAMESRDILVEVEP